MYGSCGSHQRSMTCLYRPACANLTAVRQVTAVRSQPMQPAANAASSRCSRCSQQPMQPAADAASSRGSQQPAAGAAGACEQPAQQPTKLSARETQVQPGLPAARAPGTNAIKSAQCSLYRTCISERAPSPCTCATLMSVLSRGNSVDRHW